MAKVRKYGLNAPYILYCDLEGKKIYMQYLKNSLKLRDYIFRYDKSLS